MLMQSMMRIFRKNILFRPYRGRKPDQAPMGPAVQSDVRLNKYLTIYKKSRGGSDFRQKILAVRA